MKTIAILIMFSVGCAVDVTPAPAGGEPEVQSRSSGPEASFQDCDPLTCGGGGGGGGGGTASCQSINCSIDLQCVIACANPAAECARWTSGGSSGGVCLDWH